MCVCSGVCARTKTCYKVKGSFFIVVYLCTAQRSNNKVETETRTGPETHNIMDTTKNNNNKVSHSFTFRYHMIRPKRIIDHSTKQSWLSKIAKSKLT